MRILYYYSEQDTFMYYWQRVHFIDELLREGHLVDTFNPLLSNGPDEANSEVLKMIVSTDNRYDLFLTNVCDERLLFVSTLDELKKRGIPSVCFRADNLVTPFHDKVLAPEFDLVWLTSFETQHLYNSWGCSTVFAPYAANPYTFSYQEYPLSRKMCFIGTPYGSRSSMINLLVNNDVKMDVYCKKDNTAKSSNFDVAFIPDKYGTFFTLANRLRFKEGRRLLKGTLYNKFFVHSTSLSENVCLKSKVPFEEMPKLYSRYVLSLASTSAGHTDVLRKPLNVINLRNFEIPMSGGIEICRFDEELSTYFEEGKEIVFYRSNEELVEKAKYYTSVASEFEIRQIKEQARRRAENEHCWKNRFSVIFNALGVN